MGDPAGDFCTDAYLVPKINAAYGSQLLTLDSDADSTYNERLVDVPAVPLGTTNLGIYQSAQMPTANGNVQGPLLGLFSPISVEWKQVGQPDSEYVEAGRTGKLPNVSPAAPSPPFIMQWEWRGGVICLTPVMYPVDMRVRGVFSLRPLLKDSDTLGINWQMYLATAFATAALIGVERGNAQWEKYGEQAEELLVKIENILVKAEQGTVTRIGRVGGSSSGYGNGGWYA